LFFIIDATDGDVDHFRLHVRHGFGHYIFTSIHSRHNFDIVCNVMHIHIVANLDLSHTELSYTYGHMDVKIYLLVPEHQASDTDSVSVYRTRLM